MLIMFYSFYSWFKKFVQWNEIIEKLCVKDKIKIEVREMKTKTDEKRVIFLAL